MTIKQWIHSLNARAWAFPLAWMKIERDLDDDDHEGTTSGTS